MFGAWTSARFQFTMSLSTLKYPIFLLLVFIFDYVVTSDQISDDFEIQGDNLRGGYGTDNKTFLRVVMLHVRFKNLNFDRNISKKISKEYFNSCEYLTIIDNLIYNTVMITIVPLFSFLRYWPLQETRVTI